MVTKILKILGSEYLWPIYAILAASFFFLNGLTNFGFSLAIGAILAFAYGRRVKVFIEDWIA